MVVRGIAGSRKLEEHFKLVASSYGKNTHFQQLSTSLGLMQQKLIGPWHGGISSLMFENHINVFVHQYATSLTLHQKSPEKPNKTPNRWVW